MNPIGIAVTPSKFRVRLSPPTALTLAREWTGFKQGDGCAPSRATADQQAATSSMRQVTVCMSM
jgi:hypothetical protein